MKKTIFLITLFIIFLVSLLIFIKYDNEKIISIYEFQAKCDGTSDDYEAINKAINYSLSNEIDTIDFGNKTCVVNNTIHLYCNRNSKKIRITGSATVKHNNIDFIQIEDGCEDVSIEGITSISSYNPNNRDINNDQIIDENDSIRHIRNSFDNHNLKLNINNITLIGGVTGIFGNNLKRLQVNNSTFKDMHFIPEYGRGGYGILLQGCKNVNITNSNFIAGKYFRHGIYVSVNDIYNVNNNVLINKCIFDYRNIEPVDFDKLKYPKDKIYDGIAKSNIWSPSTSPIMVRRTNNITIANSLFLNTPNTSVFSAENGNITNILLKNLELYPTSRDGEYNYGTYFSGRIKDNKINKVNGIIDNLAIHTNDKEYKYAAFSHAKVIFENANTNLSILDITPKTNIIFGFKKDH